MGAIGRTAGEPELPEGAKIEYPFLGRSRSSASRRAGSRLSLLCRESRRYVPPAVEQFLGTPAEDV